MKDILDDIRGFDSRRMYPAQDVLPELLGTFNPYDYDMRFVFGLSGLMEWNRAFFKNMIHKTADRLFYLCKSESCVERFSPVHMFVSDNFKQMPEYEDCDTSDVENQPTEDSASAEIAIRFSPDASVRSVMNFLLRLNNASCEYINAYNILLFCSLTVCTEEGKAYFPIYDRLKNRIMELAKSEDRFMAEQNSELFHTLRNICICALHRKDVTYEMIDRILDRFRDRFLPKETGKIDRYTLTMS